MTASSIEDLLMPFTYGCHLTRRFEVAALLAGTGLTAADLENPNRRITVRQLLQYSFNALDLAAKPDWYLEWAATLSDHFHGPISLALMSAPTLGDGLATFVRYFPGRLPHLHMQGRQEGDRYLVELAPLTDLGRALPLLIEAPLIILQQYLHTTYDVDFTEAATELAYPPPAYADLYDRHFKSVVKFGRLRNAAILPASWLALRNINYVESNWMHAIAQCEASLASSIERTTLADVRCYLSEAYSAPMRARTLPTLDEVAAHLCMSSRTLIRRLGRLETNYQTITDDFLRARSVELLANDGLRIKEIAGALGFNNPANFGKAFKRWFGVPPGKFRASGRSTSPGTAHSP